MDIDYTNVYCKDLNMYYCGHKKNVPNHSYGPAMRDHHLIVYVARGKGVYEINNKIYNLEPKSIFVVFPNSKVYYKADDIEPWENIWLGLYGDILNLYIGYLNLTPENPVYIIKNPIGIETSLLQLVESAKTDNIPCKVNSIGLLYKIFSELIYDYTLENRLILNLKTNEKYIEQAISFIKFNYNRDISSIDIANNLKLERTYFSKLFKKELNISPLNYLNNYRMKTASRLLLTSDLNIENIAYSVGIKDQFYFSRLFKKYFKVSPNKYKREGSKCSNK